MGLKKSNEALKRKLILNLILFVTAFCGSIGAYAIYEMITKGTFK